MKKIVKVSLVSVVSALMFVGCTPSTAKPDSHDVKPASHDAKPASHDAKTAQNTYIQHTLTQEEVHHRIETAAKKNGWRVTNFKNNTLIAEKSLNGDTTAITVHFDKESFRLIPKNGELHTIIEDALNASEDSH